MKYKIRVPLEDEKEIMKLRAGDIVLLSGVLRTARDAAHKRFSELIAAGEDLPVDFENGAVYYTGPAPTAPGAVIGPAGPTSAYRMDPYAEDLMKKGLKIMIGKGPRSEEYRHLLCKYHSVYLASIGGVAAAVTEKIKKSRIEAYADLGAEAVYELEVEDFYAIVAYDAYGGDLFTEGVKKYER